MATINNNTIAVSGSRDLLKASLRLYDETIGANKILNMLFKFGIVNREDKLTSASGSKVTMYNIPRLSAKPIVGDDDYYSRAVPMQSGDRVLQIRKNVRSVTYALDGSERQQVSEFNLKKATPKTLTEWSNCLLLYWFMNHLTSNTATTMYAPGVYDDGAITSTADRTAFCGNNAAIAPSSTYKAYGSGGANSVTADESITSVNPLVLQDFLDMREVINATNLGVPMFNKITAPIEGLQVDTVALVSTTGMTQLRQDAVTIGQGLTIPQLMYATIAGGEKVPLPGNTYVVPGTGIAFLELPDNYFARGINSSTAAPVAATRRAVMVGANAIDFALGKGFSAGGNTIPGFSMETDENYKPANKQGYLFASINGGVQKVQVYGTGANTATAYDNAIATITHYSKI